MRKVSILTATILVGAAFALGACGDDDEDGGGATTQPSGATTLPAGGSAQTLKLVADPSGALRFDTDTLSANAGTVTIELSNPSSVPHAIEVEGNGVEEEGETVEKGGLSTVTVDLKAGEYEYYCPVGNHEQEGMKGTLTVQ